MDTIDRKILAELQAEGRLTVTELAQRVSLSVAPCHRRLRELERTNAIRGYRAVIDPAAIGYGFEVLVHVTMDREDAATIASFENGLAGVAEVRHAERLFGDPDYLIRVATTDLAAYQVLRDEKLGTLPGVQRLNSTIVMKRVVDDRPFPISPPSGRPRLGSHRGPQRPAAPGIEGSGNRRPDGPGESVIAVRRAPDRVPGSGPDPRGQPVANGGLVLGGMDPRSGADHHHDRSDQHQQACRAGEPGRPRA
jgi:DNA-binding Lrp family transcriptional regulator